MANNMTYSKFVEPLSEKARAAIAGALKAGWQLDIPYKQAKLTGMAVAEEQERSEKPEYCGWEAWEDSEQERD